MCVTLWLLSRKQINRNVSVDLSSFSLSRNTENVEISNATDVESPVINFNIKFKDGTKVQSSSSVSLDEVLTFEFNNGEQRSIQVS